MPGRIRTTYTPPIDKGVPCPPVMRGRAGGGLNGRRYVRLPLREMDVGDSVFVPLTDSEPDALRNAIQRFRSRTKTPARFYARTWKERRIVGTRIWRVV